MTPRVINPFWFPSGPPPGDAAQNFDGINDRFDAGADWLPATSDKGIFSAWLQRDQTGVVDVVMQGSGAPFQFNWDAADKFVMLLKNITGGTTLLSVLSSITITDTNWHHILASWNLIATPVHHFYIDDVDRDTHSVLSTGTVNHTTIRSRIGAAASLTPNFFNKGCMSEFYYRIGDYLDFSVTANRRLFIDALGNPVSLGLDGSTPTGNQPQVYLPGDDFEDNKGTSSNLVATGSPVACAGSPA